MTEFEKQEAVVLGISVDSVAENLKLAQSKRFTFPLLSDPEGIAADFVGIRHVGGNPMKDSDIARPATLILDRQGKVVWQHYTDNWRIRPHPQTLLQELQKIP